MDNRLHMYSVTNSVCMYVLIGVPTWRLLLRKVLLVLSFLFISSLLCCENNEMNNYTHTSTDTVYYCVIIAL